jgi:hypothetical protein
MGRKRLRSTGTRDVDDDDALDGQNTVDQMRRRWLEGLDSGHGQRSQNQAVQVKDLSPVTTTVESRIGQISIYRRVMRQCTTFGIPPRQ